MIKKVFVPAVFMAASGAFAADVPGKDIAKCAVIEGDLARLECFDGIAKQHKLNGPQSQPVDASNNGKWKVEIDVNPVDDSKTVTMIINATSGEGKYGRPVFAVIRCQSNETDFYIGWGDYLGDEPYVLSRVGDAKAETSEWSISTDKTTTFHPQPVPFIKSLLTVNKLVAQVTPYNESPITAVFDTTGLNGAIKPLRETCSW